MSRLSVTFLTDHDVGPVSFSAGQTIDLAESLARQLGNSRVAKINGAAKGNLSSTGAPVSGGVAIDGAIIDAAQAPAGGVGVYLPSSGNFAGINMLWNGSVWRMQFAPGINVGLG